MPLPPASPAFGQPSAGVDRVVYRLHSILEPLVIERMFARSQPLEVELGCGDGSFLHLYALGHPETNFLGVERLLGRLRKLERKGLRSGLANLRLLRIEASYFLEYLLPAASVRAFHIYFPDPWPKRKHRKNRLINESFRELAFRGLVPGGTLFFRTDDLDYQAQITGLFEHRPDFRPLETPNPLRQVTTDFERDFLARDVAIYHTAFQKIGT